MLIGAVLADQHDEWAIGLRYMSLGTLQQVLEIANQTKKDDETLVISA